MISKDEVKKRKENMSDIRILCVDDDISMLNTIEDILINAGYAVTLAKSGKQAVEFI